MESARSATYFGIGLCGLCSGLVAKEGGTMAGQVLLVKGQKEEGLLAESSLPVQDL